MTTVVRVVLAALTVTPGLVVPATANLGTVTISHDGAIHRPT
jgi:hypothetical protein